MVLMRPNVAAPTLICVLGFAGCAATPPKSLGDGRYSISAPKERAINQAINFCGSSVKYALLDKESANEITFICVYADDPRYASKANDKGYGSTVSDTHK
jgi:hypothetical protein